MSRKTVRYSRRKKRKLSKAPFYVSVVLLLIVCAMVFRTEKPAATPEQTKEERKSFENAWIVSAKDNLLIFMADGILMQVQAEASDFNMVQASRLFRRGLTTSPRRKT